MKTETLFFINPATGSGFGEIKMTPVEEVEKAVNDMRQAFPIWSAKTLKEHIKILQKIQATLIDPQDEITRVLNQDCGKSRQDGLIEFFITVDMLAQYCTKAPAWLKPKRVSSDLYFFKKSIVEYKPHGVTAVLSPMKVKDEAEAIRLANDSAYGLGASVWSQNPSHAKAVADQIHAASIIINDCIAQFGIPMLPFGGVKESGFGRTHGQEGLMQFTRPYSYAVGNPPLN